MVEQIQQAKEVSQAGLLTYIASVGILGGATLAASEGLGRMLKAMDRFRGSKKVKFGLALLIGPLSGIGAYGAGFLPSPNTGFWAWMFAAVMGLLGTFVAKGGTDVFNKVRSK